MSILGGVGSRSRTAVAVVVLAATATAPAAAEARGGVTIAGAPAKRLRLCGAVHKTMSVTSGARVVATVTRRPRGTRSLTISRCGGGEWSRFKRVRVTSRRVRLPRLPAGGYRVAGRGLPAVYVRVLRSAAPRLAPPLHPAPLPAPMGALFGRPQRGGPPKPRPAPP